MNSLREFFIENQSIVLSSLLVLSAFLLVATIRLSVQLGRLRSRWGNLLEGSSTGNLELMLRDHLRERLKLQAQIEEMGTRIMILESKMMTAKRHMGLVRFDAFEDVGGSQSFALALFDDNGHGAVMNGLIGRTDSRVYCKPLVSGRSDRTLSQEEVRAIEEAKSTAPRAVITT